MLEEDFSDMTLYVTPAIKQLLDQDGVGSNVDVYKPEQLELPLTYGHHVM